MNGPVFREKVRPKEFPNHLRIILSPRKRYSFVNWQSGNDDSVYYNLHIPAFFETEIVMPPNEFSELERNIHPELLDLTFTAHDGSETQPLKEYLVGPKQVQAMMMAQGQDRL